MLRPTHLCSLAVALAPLACGASKSTRADPGDAAEAKAAPEPATAEPGSPPQPAAPAEVQRDPDELADLDALCAAIDHD